MTKAFKEAQAKRINVELAKSLAIKAEWEEAQAFNAENNPKWEDRRQVASQFTRGITMERIMSLRARLARLEKAN